MKTLRKISAISLMMLFTVSILSCRDTKTDNDHMDNEHQMESNGDGMMKDNN